MLARHHSLTARSAALLAALVAALLVALALAGAAHAQSTHTVSNNGDAGDVSLGDGVCDSEVGPAVACTLRAALEQANAEPGVAPGAAPHTISLSAINGQVIEVGATALPAIKIDDTVLAGCTTPPTQDPVGPCVGLRAATSGAGTGLEVEGDDVTVRSLAISRFATGVRISGTGAIVHNSDFGISVTGTTAGEGMGRGVLLTGSGGRIGGSGAAEGNAFAGNDDGLVIWGGDTNGVFGNLFGLRRDETVVGNGRGIVVAGRSDPGPGIDEATNNVIGGQSNAASEGGFCAGNCNFVAGSSVAGIDLSGGSSGETPAGGLLIAGNWIGLDAEGDGASNVLGVKVGDGGKLVAPDTAGATIGGQTPSYGNLISGNSVGVDQSDGQGVLTVWHNIFGVGPDQETPVANTTTNARLAGDFGGRDALVVRNHFGASAAGLILTGPQPCVSGNFFTPFSGTYTQAALILEGNADDARIGNELGCIAGDFTPGNAFGYTAPTVPAILIRGADDFKVVSNFIGSLPYAPPLAGPPVRIEDGPAEEPATGGRIGGDNPNHWNALTRLTGPAVVIGGHSTGIVVAGGEGIAVNDFANASSLWADLLSIPGLGNAPGGQNNGIQPPTIGVATTAGIAGTGEPGATIRLLQRWRADNPTDGITEPNDEGYTIPPLSSMTTVAPDGTWSLVYAEKLPEGQGITASQTTAAGSSEFAALKTATPAPPLPVVQITGGPTGTVTETSATFTFNSPTPGAVLECAIDGADFASCSSPKTYSGLTNGAHQFRVQARVGSTTSLPVSRAWAVDGPATPAQPEKPGAAASNAKRFAALVSLPSNKRCLSRRTIRVRLRKPGEAKVVVAEFRVTGKKLKRVSGRALNAAIDLRGLPKGTVKVRIRIVLSSGSVISGTRTFRTCATKKVKKKATKRTRR